MQHDCAVLIPVYNAARWLDRCLEGAIAQNPKYVLIWDDGSDDESLAIARRWAESDPRIAVQASRHSGVCRSRNALIAWAIGLEVEWMQFCDADDVLLPGKVGRQIAEALPESDVLWCDNLQIDYDRQPVGLWRYTYFNPAGYYYPPLPGCWLLHRRLFSRLPDLRFDVSFERHMNDLDFWLTISQERTQRTPFVGFVRRAGWSPSQITADRLNQPEKRMMFLKHPWLSQVRSIVKVEQLVSGGDRTYLGSPLDCPSGLPVVIDLSPFIDSVQDTARLEQVLRTLACRNHPVTISVVWPWDAPIDWIRLNQIQQPLSFVNQARDGDWVIRSGDDPLPGPAFEWFNPTIEELVELCHPG